jgi:toxin HigB-1
VICSFRSRETRLVFERTFSRPFHSIAQSAKRKLDHLHAVLNLSDLANVPGDRLEAIHGDRVGQYSIRVNERWRICFRWADGHAEDVEIVDYH